MNPLTLVAVAVGVAGGWAHAAGQDWPCFRGPNHDGTLAETLALAEGEPEVIWRGDVGGGHGSVAVVGGKLYVLGNRKGHSLLCLDAATGRELWATPGFQGGGNQTPTVHQDRIFVTFYGPRGPTAGCASAADGKELWRAPLPDSTGKHFYGLSGSPRAWEDLVFFNVAGGAAVRQATGEVAWSHPGHTGYATPVVFTTRGKPAVAFFTGDRLIARDARSGRELWTIPWETKLHVSACDPVFLGDRVFVCSAYGRGRSLYDVGGPSPRALWDISADGSGHAFVSGFARDGALFFHAANGLARADLDNGKPVWESRGTGGTLLIGNTLVQMGHRGELTAGTFTPDQPLKPTLRAKLLDGTTFAQPAYWDKRLYARSEKGELVCVRVGK